MAHEIFVSLTHQDAPIAEALRDALRQLFDDTLLLRFSTSKEIDEGIRHGENWFEWIVQRVQQSDFALILITPGSVQKPWILWEAGAVHGAALASGQGGLRKVRPLVFQLDAGQLPSPIRESQTQVRYGDRAQDVTALFEELLLQYEVELKGKRFAKANQRLRETVDSYIEKVTKALRTAPMLPTSAVIEEWRLRLDELLAQNRASEVEHLHAWIDIAFGRERDDKAQPLDLRIHARLADLYMKAKKYPKAIEQLELASRLAPRDIFVLRSLGQAFLENGERDKAKGVIDRIAVLDPSAFEHNTECAALAGRWYRQGGNLRKAAEIYRAALDRNHDSHYLANLIGEVCLEAGDKDGARMAYERVAEIIEGLKEQNVWTRASSANAAFALGDDSRAMAQLRLIRREKPDVGALASVEKGLKSIAPRVENGPARVQGLLAALYAD